MSPIHRSGFVNIIGDPNVGKSTLMNRLVGERMSIINRKPQTTRHRIIGIVNEDDYQIVFSDTPGHVESPQYQLHKTMNSAMRQSFEDADLMLYMTTVHGKVEEVQAFFNRAKKMDAPLYLLINKCDLMDTLEVKAMMDQFQELSIFDQIHPISAQTGLGTEALMQQIISVLPESPPYYPKDQLTDKPERFFISEIIREKIMMQYKEEIPYCSEVAVETFREKENLVEIYTVIYVMRESQKGILLGHEGKAMKRMATSARLDMEKWLDKKVYLDVTVKVNPGWRDNEGKLKKLGYG